MYIVIVEYTTKTRCVIYMQVKPNVLCITYKKYRDEGNRGHVLDKLEPGNYTYRIRATSLAGNGSWTSPLTFSIKDIKSKSLFFCFKYKCVCQMFITVSHIKAREWTIESRAEYLSHCLSLIRWCSENNRARFFPPFWD